MIALATGETKSTWKGNGKKHDPPLEGAESTFNISLAYDGKRSTQEILATPPAHIDLIWQGDRAGTNRLYYGDNRPILASLIQDATVYKQVKLIYIDPPFSTNSVFKSRSQMDAYSDLLVGAHYLEFMRERLILLRELLAEDGSLYVHIDDTMAFYIKVILDEVFGRRNFRNCITRRKCNPKNYTRKAYGNISDYIFFYTKSETYTWNRPFEAWTDQRAEREYQYIEPETGRRFKKVPLHAPGVRHGETGTPWRGMNPPPGKHWQYPPKTLDEMDARGEIFWSSNGNPRRKIYLDNSQGIPLQDIWWDLRDAHNQNIQITGYPTEKNFELLTKIINASSNPGDLVLDSFAGSGTTLAAASQSQRGWIGIDNSPTAIQATLGRFAHGLKPMGDFVTKQNSSEEKQLALDLFHETADHDTIAKNHLITDFTVYVTLPYNGDIDPVLEEWK